MPLYASPNSCASDFWVYKLVLTHNKYHDNLREWPANMPLQNTKLHACNGVLQKWDVSLLKAFPEETTTVLFWFCYPYIYIYTTVQMFCTLLCSYAFKVNIMNNIHYQFASKTFFSFKAAQVLWGALAQSFSSCMAGRLLQASQRTCHYSSLDFRCLSCFCLSCNPTITVWCRDQGPLGTITIAKLFFFFFLVNLISLRLSLCVFGSFHAGARLMDQSDTTQEIVKSQIVRIYF